MSSSLVFLALVLMPYVAYGYIGCFRDKPQRAMSGGMIVTNQNSAKFCIAVCRSKGFRFAGTQYSRECFCGDDYDDYGSANNCNMPCSGNAKEKCGGTWALSVYATGYIGCFRDKPQRAMSGGMTVSNQNSAQSCTAVCKSKGFKFAGTQYSRECFCGDDYDDYGSANNCNMGCPGNAKEKCGGTWALSVYTTGYIGCFRDKPQRAMSGGMTVSNQNSAQFCIAVCESKGFTFAGTQYSRECFCGDDYDDYGSAGNCNMDCPGNAKEKCGGTWALSVYRTAVPRIRGYVGCFRDKPQRAMSGGMTVTSQNSAYYCTTLCKSKGFTFAGTQYSRECFCGNDYDDYGPANNCNMPCTGDANQKCGGTWALSVYRSGYFGCFRDKPQRAMSGGMTVSGQNSAKFCISICRNKGFKFAGTQYSRECFCGNDYDDYGPANNCNMPCTGNRKEMCGGTWALSVYST